MPHTREWLAQAKARASGSYAPRRPERSDRVRCAAPPRLCRSPSNAFTGTDNADKGTSNAFTMLIMPMRARTMLLPVLIMPMRAPTMLCAAEFGHMPCHARHQSLQPEAVHTRLRRRSAPSPHLHRDSAHPCHICIGTGPTPPLRHRGAVGRARSTREFEGEALPSSATGERAALGVVVL